MSLGICDKSLEGRQRLFFPHFTNNCVPLNAEANARWRLNAFSSHRGHQKELLKMCREDLLFWVTGFGSVYDAGDESGTPGRVSFIPYPFQIDVFTALWSAMYDKRCQIRVKKPRRMGLTWQAVALLQHCWQFMGERQVLIGSHREEEVDASASSSKSGRFVGEWSKLLPKFDYMQIYQPKWMLPNGFVPRAEPFRMRMKMLNPESGAIVWGTSAASKTAHGERGWAAWWDEASQTENLYDIIGGLSAFSPCKIWTSTIGDLSHPFSTILKDSPSVFQVAVSWDMNPEYTDGLSIDEKTGKPTSDWLERKLADINYDPATANRMYFADEGFQVGSYYGGGRDEANCLLTMFGRPGTPGTIRPAVRRGELVIEETPDGPVARRFIDSEKGRWKFWIDLDGESFPRGVPMVWGADVAAGSTSEDGTGKSNSVLVVLRHDTLEVIATCVAHGLVPYEFAMLTAAGLRWLSAGGEEPFGSFENNGPGTEFGDVIRLRCKYENLHSETKDRSVTGSRFGWYKGGGEETARWFALHRQMICEGTFIERDEDCAMEMREFQYSPTGKGPPIYLPSVNSPDPSGARENHGDRAIARIAAIVASVARPYELEPDRKLPPAGSYDYFEYMDELEANAAIRI